MLLVAASEHVPAEDTDLAVDELEPDLRRAGAPASGNMLRCSMRWRLSAPPLNVIPNAVFIKDAQRYLLMNLTLARRQGFKASPRC